MLNLIENKFRKHAHEVGKGSLPIIIIMGDWSIEKQMRDFISTPNIWIKRKLNERFAVFNIDEFRTSSLHHKTEEICGNLSLPDKTNKLRKLHSVLTFTMENNGKGCINRDYNGCLNIKKIFDSFMRDGTRPQRYCRGYDLTKNTGA